MGLLSLFFGKPPVDDYYDNIKYPSNESEFESIKNYPRTSKIRTENIIKYKRFNFGISEKELIKVLAKPNHISKANYFAKSHNTYFYKLQRDEIQSLFQFHFIDNKLIYINRFYKNSFFKTNIKILNEIEKLYGITLNLDSIKEDNALIIDPNGSQLNIGFEFEIKMEYISSEFFKL